MNRYPTRRTPVHQPVRQILNRPSIVFLTVCTNRRKRILDRDDAFATIQSAWARADHWMIGRFVVMPDHIRLFCAPASETAFELERWVAFWKSEASRHWPRPHEHELWEPDVWDRQLRSSESYEEKWKYVWNNPVRHGLVDRAEDWSYAGEWTIFEW